MFNLRSNNNTPCLNCTERWIDVDNNKRCHDTCDRHLQNVAKSRAIHNHIKVDKKAKVMYIKPKQNKLLMYEINKERGV